MLDALRILKFQILITETGFLLQSLHSHCHLRTAVQLHYRFSPYSRRNYLFYSSLIHYPACGCYYLNNYYFINENYYIIQLSVIANQYNRCFKINLLQWCMCVLYMCCCLNYGKSFVRAYIWDSLKLHCILTLDICDPAFDMFS